MFEKVFYLGKTLFEARSEMWMTVIGLCILLFLFRLLTGLIIRPTPCKIKRLNPQEFIDIAEWLGFEIFDHKASLEDAVLLKARNRYAEIQYVTDKEERVRQYFNGEISNIGNDERKKGLVAEYKTLQIHFLAIRCGNDYEIISKIGNTMVTFKGKYRKRNQILYMARKFSCVPKKGFRNDCTLQIS